MDQYDSDIIDELVDIDLVECEQLGNISDLISLGFFDDLGDRAL